MEVSVEVDGGTSICLDGGTSFCFLGSFHLTPPTPMETSMEVNGSNLLPRKLVEASVEVDGSFHGSTLKKSIY